MLQIFRDNQIFIVLFVIFYFAAFGANIWLYPNNNLLTFQESPSTLGNALYGWLSDPFNNRISFSILLLVQALYVNTIVNNFKLAKEYSFIPAVCFIALHFIYADIDCCSPAMVANTFLIWAVHSLWASYDKNASLGAVFNAGFGVGVAALLYHGHIVFFPWVLMALLVIRSFDLQEFILIVSGFFIPFFFMGTYHFLGDNLGNWMSTELGVNYFNAHVFISFNAAFYIAIAVLFGCFGLAASNLQGLYFKTTSREKKYINVVFLMAAMALFSFLFQHNIYSYHLVSFLVPMAILLSITLQSYKSIAAAEAVHFLLFMICMGIQYQAFFFQS